VPLIVTRVPTGPEAGEKPEMVGGDVDEARERLGMASRASETTGMAKTARRRDMVQISPRHAPRSIGWFPTY
jgi:hypothetical protein